jgi:hypothetical protein
MKIGKNIVYHTIALEGAGHHGLAAIVDGCLKRQFGDRVGDKMLLHELVRHQYHCEFENKIKSYFNNMNNAL